MRLFSRRLWFGSDVIAMIDKETLKRRLAAMKTHPFTLIDVREPSEMKYGTIPGSINIPQREIPVAFGLRPGEFQRKFGVPKVSVLVRCSFFVSQFEKKKKKKKKKAWC
jgi:rhodanese-related sulfurtransferase